MSSAKKIAIKLYEFREGCLPAKGFRSVIIVLISSQVNPDLTEDLGYNFNAKVVGGRRKNPLDRFINLFMSNKTSNL